MELSFTNHISYNENIHLSIPKRALMQISEPPTTMRYGHQGVGEPL